MTEPRMTDLRDRADETLAGIFGGIGFAQLIHEQFAAGDPTWRPAALVVMAVIAIFAIGRRIGRTSR